MKVKSLYSVLNNEVSSTDRALIPVADGVFLTDEMIKPNGQLDGQSGDFAITFYDADGVTPVTPTAGSIYVEAIMREGSLQTPSSGDYPINATKCIIPSAVTSGASPETFSVPALIGGIIYGRMRLEGVTGASFCRAEFRRFP